MYIYLQTLEGWDKTPRIFIDLIGKIRQLNVHKLSFKLYAEDTDIEFKVSVKIKTSFCKFPDKLKGTSLTVATINFSPVKCPFIITVSPE